MERALLQRSRTQVPANVATSWQVTAWLLVCCALVFTLVVVGGVTRLTRSGLSIVEWQPIVGVLPPFSDAQWQEAFLKYQQSPEYQKVNTGMPLSAFKGIFWWEYVHRLLGRLVGLVFFLPLVYFAVTGRIGPRLALRLFGVFALGAVQGALGWYMVKSGLVDDPRVSHYRLTAHLGMAFLIFAALLWTSLDLLVPQREAPDPGRHRLYRFAVGLSVLVLLMVLSGGLVAGLHAGLAYNTFPLMNGYVVPPNYFELQPWYRNVVDNAAAVQFNHRLIAVTLTVLIALFWVKSRVVRLQPSAQAARNLLLLVFALQIALGISTLLLAVPIPLAATHQAGALTLFAVSLWNCHELR